MTGVSTPGDPGLQNERTTLAWSRTTLSIVGLGALAAKESDSVVLGGTLLLVVGVATLAIADQTNRRHRRRNLRLRTGESVDAFAEIAITTAIVVLLATVGLVAGVT